MTEEVKKKLGAQEILSQKIHELIISGNYPLPMVISVMEMLKVEYMMQAYLNHVSKGAQKNLIQMGHGGSLSPEMIEKLKKSKH